MADKKSGKDWTKGDIALLKKMKNQNTDTDIIAKKLERSKNAVYIKVSELGLSLMPKDK
ncbi:MAG: hypothetical protein ABUK01_00505 [Leptospirales bacterium]